ncbi:MAG: hypothetical protein NVSMB6_28340 [Burkholderiaceae bacterium]
MPLRILRERKILVLIAGVGVAILIGAATLRRPGGFGGMPDPAIAKCQAQAAKDPRATALLGGESKFVEACLRLTRVTRVK